MEPKPEIASSERRLRGCNLHPTRWRTRFLRSTTNLHSGASRAAPREPPVDLFEQPTELNGILAFIPDGGDDPNHIPIGLLPPNGQRLSCGRAGRASGWIAYSNSVRRARQLQARVKPNGP